jgi:hypothetical protein
VHNPNTLAKIARERLVASSDRSNDHVANLDVFPDHACGRVGQNIIPIGTPFLTIGDMNVFNEPKQVIRQVHDEITAIAGTRVGSSISVPAASDEFVWRCVVHS